MVQEEVDPLVQEEVDPRLLSMLLAQVPAGGTGAPEHVAAAGPSPLLG